MRSRTYNALRDRGGQGGAGKRAARAWLSLFFTVSFCRAPSFPPRLHEPTGKLHRVAAAVLSPHPREGAPASTCARDVSKLLEKLRSGRATRFPLGEERTRVLHLQNTYANKEAHAAVARRCASLDYRKMRLRHDRAFLHIFSRMRAKGKPVIDGRRCDPRFPEGSRNLISTLKTKR